MKYPGLIALAALTGCAGLTETADVPAVLLDPDPAEQEALAGAVSRMLGVVAVTLAPDALANTNILTVERRQIRSPDGVPLNGRDLGRPEVFTLVKRGARCFLVHAGSGTRSELMPSRCQALQAP